MQTIPPRPVFQRRRTRARRLVSLALIACAGAVSGPSPGDSGVLFARDAAVPHSVREFAWRVIETRCNYQGYERGQRTFWAYHTRVTKLETGVAYSIEILSERGWDKSEPPATIQLAILYDGRLHLTGLTSTFVSCR
jgi:hypothetical protein